MSKRRVVLIAGADDYVGPALAVVMAKQGMDLVLGSATLDLIEQCQSQGARVANLPDAHPHNLETGPRMVALAMEEFGGYSSVFFSSGQIALGRFLKTSPDDLRAAFEGNVMAPYVYIQSVLPHLLEKGDGQILVATSATANRPTPSASLYAGTRSAATTMLQSVGLEIADSGVQLNVVGTNFMDFHGFLKGNKAETPEGRARVESMVPMKRLGTMEEFAHYCAVFLDGTSRFQTGTFTTYAGGWAI